MQKKLELDGDENFCVLKFLAGKSEQRIKLNRILGIGGEGMVLKDEILTSESHYKWNNEKKEEKEMAVKFVEFEKIDEDDFDAAEIEDEKGEYGGIKEDGSFVRSSYFKKLRELGDFVAATGLFGGYVTPYADFAISEIYGKFYFIVGKLEFSRINKVSFR